MALADELYAAGRRDTPTGTIIGRLDPQDEREEWLKLRRTGIGSSDMAAVLGIMGLNDYLLLIVKPLLTGYVVGYLSIWFGSRIEHGPHGIRRALPAAFATSLIATIAIGALITALL